MKMIEKDYLPHFLKEPIYLLDEQNSADINQETADAAPALVEENTASTIESQFSLQDLNTIGNWESSVFVLVNTTVNQVIPEQDHAFLLKIFAAVNLAPEHIIIVNAAQIPEKNLPTLFTEYSGKTCFSFDSRLEQILEHTKYTPMEHHLNKVIFAHSLSDIAADVNKKKQLWSLLQSVFPK